MDVPNVSTVHNVTLSRRGYSITGSLVLSRYHLVFSFNPNPKDQQAALREIWICYPIIDKMKKSRGSSWIEKHSSNGSNSNPNFNDIDLSTPRYPIDDYDHYSSSHIKLQCKDFTYYSFDFINDMICTEVFRKLSLLITAAKSKHSIREFYAFDYKPNLIEQQLPVKGWDLYDPLREYERQGLIGDKGEGNSYWRVSEVNREYKFCPSYPNTLIIPASISDNVLKHASKFRSKQRIPAIVYRHRSGTNGNVIARCSQPLVGLNIQNRSIQDERLIAEIFESQKRERSDKLNYDNDPLKSQPQKNLIVDLRPITNAMAQHALGAGTENIDNYRGRMKNEDKKVANGSPSDDNTKSDDSANDSKGLYHVDKIFCNIDNIHVMRDSLNKLISILSELDKYPVSTNANKTPIPLLQQSLNKTQWLHRISIVLQSVDRITKSVHLNNTNVVIHCSDGWDRTSQVSALLQLCLDPYYRTIEGFMVLIEKEWVSFGFKFATRGDHGGCVGALVPKQSMSQNLGDSYSSKISQTIESAISEDPQKINGGGMSLFLQKAARAANHLKNTAQNAAASSSSSASTNGSDVDGDGKSSPFSTSSYSASNEKSPIFHQFLDCVYQIYRQHPCEFEFNSRFLKRLFYHYYSCQYGSFLCDSERELKEVYQVQNSTVSVWDYFKSRPAEFCNKLYKPNSRSPSPSSDDSSSSLKDKDDDLVLFFNFTDVKWWYELYGRSDEEMNGLSNSLDRKFAQMKLHSSSPSPST
ncbi:phosphatases II [Hyphopichia burtonii NRRL Y-1933]|uniref:Phosphatases II n=1 Tax=Hyphopichia burtonii NRRL Y-1933 TaxID=984485 RepID=A0A1E4RI08_9ASCO|nr:phosphatases II [Hyphopichia burtonii NRRL Y-1933]ODV66907.1 phosphatases II [Hyphopichia burtonii NRRL Y-1933]